MGFRVGSGGSGWGCQVGCERRIEVIVKMQKKIRGGGSGPGGDGGLEGWGLVEGEGVGW